MTQQQQHEPYTVAENWSSITGLPVMHESGEVVCNFLIAPNNYPGANEINAKAVAHAALVCEAFNVYHEMGLTPRQLAKQHIDLFNMLGYLIDACDTADISAIPTRLNIVRTRFAEIRESVRSHAKGAADV